MTRKSTFICIMLATSLAAGTARADAPKPDFTNLPAYIQALNASTDPQAVAIREEIANGPAALAKARAAAQAAGIPLTVTTPDVPADQNAAPLYDQWRQAQKQSSTPYLPEYADPLSPKYAYTPDQLARVRQFFDNHAATALLHEAVAKPELVYPSASPNQMPATFMHYAALREAARELVTESYLLAHDGSYTGAVADQAYGFQIAKQMMAQPTLITYLVARAVDAITLKEMQNILMMAEPNADVDAQVAQAVQDAEPTLSLKDALTGEVAIGVSELNMLHAATPEALASLTAQNSSQVSEHLPKTFTPEQQAFVNNLLDAPEAQYLTDMEQLVATADTPAQDAGFAAVQSQVTTAASDPTRALDPLNVISNILGGGVAPLLRDLDRDTKTDAANRQVTLAAAAILEARAKTGAFPDALPGDFADPFTGKPLGYRREGDNGFVVYSVGPDGTFQGGGPGQYDFGSPQTFFRYPAPHPQPLPPDMAK